MEQGRSTVEASLTMEINEPEGNLRTYNRKRNLKKKFNLQGKMGSHG